MKRHSNAIAISQGACNPIAIVNSMAQAIAEIRANGPGDTDTILQDPALKLMTHQLAFLQGIPTSERAMDWAMWLEACEKEAQS